MVTLTVDNQTYAALCEQAAARGMSVEEWLKTQSSALHRDQPPEPPFGEQMARLFAKIGLTDEETIPELKGQAVRLPDFE